MSSANSLFFLLVLAGPVISLSSSNWVVVWAGVELSFLGLIPLLFSGNKYMSMSKESAMKYFCVQALGSALLFYSGLLTFSGSSSLLSSLLFVLSIFIKLGSFPIHFWVPSVAGGLELLPLYLVFTFQKIPSFALLICVMSDYGDGLYYLVSFLGGLTALIGAFMGMNQTDLRAMIGCSSIAHTGWMILASVSGYFWLYFIIYCISLAYFFYCLARSLNPAGTGMGLLSLSGLPPFMMFVGKWSVLVSCVTSGVPMSLLGLLVGGAVISLVFYLKFMYSFVLNSKGLIWGLGEKTFSMSFLIFNSLGLLLFFGI